MMKTTRLLSYQDDINNQNLASEKDLVDKIREAAAIRNAEFKRKTARYQLRHVRP